MANREWGQMGTGYLRSLFALGFQGFLILICVAIYAVPVSYTHLDVYKRQAFIIDCGKEVSNLERRMAELAAGDTAGRRTDHARSTATPER